MMPHHLPELQLDDLNERLPIKYRLFVLFIFSMILSKADEEKRKYGSILSPGVNKRHEQFIDASSLKCADETGASR